MISKERAPTFKHIDTDRHETQSRYQISILQEGRNYNQKIKKPPRLDVTKPSFLNHAESLIKRPFLKADPQERINLLLEEQWDRGLTKFLHRSVTLSSEWGE